VRLKGRVDHADEADEPASAAEFGGEEGEAVLRLMGLDARDEGVGFFARERRGEVLHHARVGGDAMEWLAVLVALIAD